MKRKILSLFLVVCMLLAWLPAAASAGDESSTGTVYLQIIGNGQIEKISAEQADIVWEGSSGTQTLVLETIEGQAKMNAHYHIIADAGYRIKSVTLDPAGEGSEPVEFDLTATSGEGQFFGRVLDGENRLIAGSVRWLAENGDRLAAEFESTTASRETVAAEGEMGLVLAQTLSGVNNVTVKDTLTVSGSVTITKDTEIQNGTVTVDTGAALDINGCDFGPDFIKDTTNPSKLVNNGIINVNEGGALFLIDENNGTIIVKSGGVMEAGVLNKDSASITVESGGEARCAMGGNIQNASDFTVNTGGVLKPQKGAGFKNYIGENAGTLTLNGDVIFNEGYWSDFSLGTLAGSGRFVINYRIESADLGSLQSAVTGSGASLQIVNESVVELDSADYAAFKTAVDNSVVRAIYLKDSNITIDENLDITDKNIYLECSAEGSASFTLNAGKTLTFTDTSGTGFQCGLTNVITNNENYERPSTSLTVNGRLVLADGASIGGYIGTITIGEGGEIDNSDGNIDVRYTVYCNGTITNMDYTDRAETGRLRIFTNGILIKDGTAILGEQSGSIAAAQTDAAALSMSVSRGTELLENTIYDDDPTPVAMTLTKDLTVSADTLLWVPDLATYEHYINIGDTEPGTGQASLTVDSGTTLTIESGATLRLNGPLTNNGTVCYSGSITGDGAIGGIGLFVLAPNTTVKVTTGGGTIRGSNDTETIGTVNGKGYTVGSDGKLITSHSIYAADNSLDLEAGAGLEGLKQNGAALAPPVGLAQAAVATAGLDTGANYAAKLVATLENVTQNNGTTLVYDIKPQISANGGSWTDITALEGDSANNTSVSFRLPVPADTMESYVRIVHKNGGIIKSIDFYPVLTDVAGNKYAEITTKSFSTFEMGFTEATEAPHTVTLHNGGAGAAGGGSYIQGVTVAIHAGTRSGYSFSGWTASQGLTFENAKNADTTFIMPDEDVTVTANWRHKGGGGSSSGGDSGVGPEDGAYTAPVIAEKPVVPVFNDTANHWAKADIEFVTARNLFSGTGSNQFSPDVSMTRGMFVTVLGRLAGIDAGSYKNTRFTDITMDAYCGPYAAWAAAKGIVSGTGAATFAPDQAISRQEMAAIMANYAKVMNCILPKNREAVTFEDDAEIAAWARDAVQTMQMAGVMGGKGNNRFDSAATATRAEVSAVLHRYLLAIGV